MSDCSLIQNVALYLSPNWKYFTYISKRHTLLSIKYPNLLRIIVNICELHPNYTCIDISEFGIQVMEYMCNWPNQVGFHVICISFRTNNIFHILVKYLNIFPCQTLMNIMHYICTKIRKLPFFICAIINTHSLYDDPIDM